MSLASLLRLFFLAAIWGASFLFMRMAANSLGAVVGIIWSKTKPTKSMILGLLLGLIGVAILVGQNHLVLNTHSLIAIAAALSASLCYAIASHYTKNAPKLAPFDNAHGSMWAASFIVLPLILFIPIREVPSTDVMLGVLALGVVCTALAYILFFKLIDDIGPTSALTVTFLIPLFGIFWGHVILDEQIGPNTLLGALFVIVGTMLVTGFLPRKKHLAKTS